MLCGMPASGPFIQKTNHAKENMTRFREFVLLSILKGELCFKATRFQIHPRLELTAGSHSQLEGEVGEEMVDQVGCDAEAAAGVPHADGVHVGELDPQRGDRAHIVEAVVDPGMGGAGSSAHGERSLPGDAALMMDVEYPAPTVEAREDSNGGGSSALSGGTGQLPPVYLPGNTVAAFCEAARAHTMVGKETFGFLLGEPAATGGFIITRVLIPTQEASETSCTPDHYLCEDPTPLLKLGWIHVRGLAVRVAVCLRLSCPTSPQPCVMGRESVCNVPGRPIRNSVPSCRRMTCMFSLWSRSTVPRPLPSCVRLEDGERRGHHPIMFSLTSKYFASRNEGRKRLMIVFKADHTTTAFTMTLLLMTMGTPPGARLQCLTERPIIALSQTAQQQLSSIITVATVVPL